MWNVSSNSTLFSLNRGKIFFVLLCSAREFFSCEEKFLMNFLRKVDSRMHALQFVLCSLSWLTFLVKITIAFHGDGA
jgi:hypothetical protein